VRPQPNLDYISLFQFSPGLFLVLLPNLTIVEASNAYLEATLTSRDEIIGRALFEVFPDNPDDIAATGVSNLRASLDFVLQHKQPHTMAAQKYDIRRPDGSFEVRHWSPQNKPVLQNGEIIYIIHSVQDITDFVLQKQNNNNAENDQVEIEIYKRAAEIQEVNKKLLFEITERKKTEEKFKGLLESAPDAMIIANQAGEIVLANRQAEVLFGYTISELINQPVEILVPQIDREKHKNHRTNFSREPKVRTMGAGIELYALRKDNTSFPVEISLSPLQTFEGMLVAAAIRDITERKKAEESIQQLNKELESFTYSVSHDLRAPLRIIDGYADILVSDYKEKLDPDGRKSLDIIKTNAQRMGKLIDDLLNLSHTGRKELFIYTTDMNKLINLVIEEQLAVNNKEIDIKVERLHPALCDSSLIRQVWTNLISNAIKYSAKKERPSVHISSVQNKFEIVYSIKDNGVGFDMQYAGKLFSVFQRLHKVTEFEGTGVGLALIKRIINKHGGRVWAESEVNKGSVFYFSLPI
jgi:PAS domain S-box-containing protein